MPPPSARPPDELVRTVSADGGIALRSLVGTALVTDAVTRHHMAPTAASALGRLLMGALLLAGGAKDEETVQIHLRGDGPLGPTLAIADSAARVRGYAGDPGADPPLRAGRLDVAGAVGQGVLTVVRTRRGWKEPQTGIVPIVAGEVARDLAHYLAESEQTPSAVALGVVVGAGGSIEAAAGYLVQALPGADDAALARAEANLLDMEGASRLVREGLGADGLLDRLLDGVGGRERHRTRPRFECPCSRERVLRSVALLGQPELREIARSGEPLEVICEFCATRYEVVASDVLALLAPEGRAG
jgi:molecular chaperone Hsp33